MRRSDTVTVHKMLRALQFHQGDEIRMSPSQIGRFCMGGQKRASVWLATAGGKPVAFALARDWMNFVRGFMVRHIDLLFVAEDFRTKGIGSSLIEHVTRDAFRTGCGRVDIGAAKNNRIARNCYEKLGFKPRANYAVQYQLARKLGRR